MEYVTWKNEYSVGESFLDAQHKGLFEIVDRLYSAMNSGKGNEITGSILLELERYSIFHFTEEEKFMNQVGFPNLENHKAEHRKFIEEVSAFKSDMKEGKIGISYNLLKFLEDWLIAHIQNSDAEYCRFIKNKDK